MSTAFANVGPKPTDGTALRHRALSASIWTIGGYGGSQVLRLAGNVILAALLAPGAFGLMAIVAVFLQGLQLFSDTGIRPAIIHHARGDQPEFLNTAWTIQACRGALLWGMTIAIALPVASFYGEPLLRWLLPVAGLSMLVAGLNSTGLVTLNRRLILGRLTAIELATRAFQVAVTIVWAILHPSVWALVGGTLAGTAVRLVVSHTLLADGVRNRLHWDRAAARMLFDFGKWVFVGTIIGFLAMQLDRLLLGKLVSIETLGVYSIATVLGLAPRRICEDLSWRVLFPMLSSKARSNRRRLQFALRRARDVILPAAVVAVASVALVAPLFFELLYRQEYADAGWMAQLVCFPVWFMILSGTSSKALYAVGDARSVTASGLTRLLVGGAGCVIGFLLWGLPGFIVGFGTGAAAAYGVIVLVLARRGIGILRQDLLYTAAAGVVVGLGLLPPLLAPASGNPRIYAAAGAAVALSGAAAWGFRRGWTAWKGTRQGAEAAAAPRSESADG